jgi:hypothetical protein
MLLKRKKLGITQLSLDLFVLAHKNNHEIFRNSPSIPPTTKTEYSFGGGLLEV